ncbi:diguanylate cyclase (GGDEF) domain-containing protein [Halolactibacillus halophilus]|uniref:Diguanylate cyclase n=1 Tax=Halolactibacillus halophilus TaxID=306540 RepID=A0A1I5R0X5_9BACI|nr:GGDEF domain-containing protein [Halolactibacillus halophilus]GEM01971.1 diguanylate cyclase [Halolactibacillus halophilus]SFP51716.1 diguanylate cyclase (GGDEF) domain-containing protein [Halolactibacillus halophilus]
MGGREAESFLQAISAVDVTGVCVNTNGEILYAFGKDIKVSPDQTLIFDSVDNYSKKRLNNILDENKSLGTTDIYLKVPGEKARAYFLKYVKNDDGYWLIFIPYPDQYRKMVENMFNANSELTRLFEEKLSLEMELKIKVNELKAMSITDPLTKLYNRQFFYEYLEELVKEASWQAVTLIMVDFNDFKQVNDKFGHKAGDTLLINFADMIRKYCHKGFRFGGDEFVIVSLDKDEAAIHQHLDSINEAFKHKTKIVTLSYGMARISQDQKQQLTDKIFVDELLKEADKRMYQYKREIKKSRESYR